MNSYFDTVIPAFSRMCHDILIGATRSFFGNLDVMSLPLNIQTGRLSQSLSASPSGINRTSYVTIRCSAIARIVPVNFSRKRILVIQHIISKTDDKSVLRSPNHLAQEMQKYRQEVHQEDQPRMTCIEMVGNTREINKNPKSHC